MTVESRPRPALLRVTIGSFVGTVIEQYDFLLYGFMTALVRRRGHRRGADDHRVRAPAPSSGTRRRCRWSRWPSARSW
ncbi:MHS family MFS transporter [Nonomuraea sp. C10]|uniref:MHS family MFS transporter n=1 Tax=Nonomuraea sp. C10 TaxID=2600577 RepID=UPI0011CE9DAC|nr:MHS family MFS transporter [Nonomuraea sp. C10]TXK35256.1 MHS family MFS transporter [Nonomuraea sp. C10]